MLVIAGVDWQILYEIKAGGVDERRLAGAQLQKMVEGEPGIPALEQLNLRRNFRLCGIYDKVSQQCRHLTFHLKIVLMSARSSP